MKITRNPARERTLLDAFRASFMRDERTGVHLSDTLKVRQAYWGRVLPIPPSDSDVLYFLAGRGHEEVFARLCGVQVGATDAKQVAVPGLVAGEQRFVSGISYRPDFRWDAVPAEFKTRRRNLAKPGEEAVVYDSYLEQLKGYSALDDVPEGRLIVFSLLEGQSNDPRNPTHPELAVYDVEFELGELVLARQHLGRMAHLFTIAMELQKSGPPEESRAAYDALPLCAPWMCGKNRKTVLTAAHCVECDKDLAEPWASKHATTKTGRGHTVTPEEVRWEYLPRCKHYVFCQPQKVDPTRGTR